MAVKIFLFALLACLLTGCGDKPLVNRITEVRGVKMGSVFFPYNGEGSEIRAGETEGTFGILLAEVVPFEHQIFRILLIAPEIPGEEDVELAAYRLLKEEFGIDAKGLREVSLECTQIRIFPAYRYGYRAVAVEFTDRKLAAVAAELKKEPRFAEAVKTNRALEDIRIIERAIHDYEYDIGRFPADLQELKENSACRKGWNGPYFDDKIPVDPWHRTYVYECGDGKTYQLYSRGSDGKGKLR